MSIALEGIQWRNFHLLHRDAPKQQHCSIVSNKYVGSKQIAGIESRLIRQQWYQMSFLIAQTTGSMTRFHESMQSMVSAKNVELLIVPLAQVTCPSVYPSQGLMKSTKLQCHELESIFGGPAEYHFHPLPVACWRQVINTSTASNGTCNRGISARQSTPKICFGFSPLCARSSLPDHVFTL